MNCNHCQEQLLHYLYDVLEADERALLVRHLDECAACQAARDALRARQELLAEAAKESFDQVSFQPPSEMPRRLAEPAQVVRPRERGFSWVRVAVAASVVLFVMGGGSLGVWGWIRTKNDIQVAEAKVQEAHKKNEEFQRSLQVHQQRTQEEIRAIHEQINGVFDDWSRDATALRKLQQDKTAVRMHFPRGAAAGAKIDVAIDVPKSTAQQKAAAKTPSKATADMTRGQLSVIDNNSNKRVYTQEVPRIQERNTLSLPPQAIPPGANWAVQFDLLSKDGTLLAREEASLTAPEYLTHLMTDRPMYRPGEVVRFRSLTLERFSLKPPEEDLHLSYKVLGPNQQELAKVEGGATLVTDQNRVPIQGPDGKPLRGLGAGEFQIPLDQAGGQYTISCSEGQNRFPPEKRSFLVSQWQMPRMNKELKFHRSSYGPNDMVEVQAVAKRAEGGAPLAGQPVHVRAVVDNAILLDARLQTDFEGKVRPPVFKLPPPERLTSGQGTVSIEFNDGAGPETIVRPIPLVLNRLHVEFFPEGGDLIQGVTNRVYFQARNTLGKPAELKGRIVDQTGNAVADVETLHDDQEEGINQGQGAFSFVPAAGKRYELKIETPIGIQGKHPLPKTETKGVVLHLTKPTAEFTIDATVTSADKQRLLMVGAYCRGRLLDQRQVVAPPGKPVPVTLKTAAGVSGVYRVTVYEVAQTADGPQFLPRAERLTYRKGAERLDVALDGVKDDYYPGARVNLSLKAHNEKKEKTPAVALVSVVDLSLIKLADDKTDRGMPTHFLLTSEIRKPEDLENADVLLGAHPKAEAALDLLLGTQGWRRFAEQDPQRFQRMQPREAQRIVQALALPNQQRDSVNDVVAEKVDKAFAAKAVKLLEVLAQKEAVENAPLDAAMQQQIVASTAESANRALADAQAGLREYERRIIQYLGGAFIVGMLLAGLGAVALGFRRLGQGRPAQTSLVTGTALLLFLFMGSLAGVFYMIGSKGENPLAFNQPKAMDQAAEVAVPQMAAPMGQNAPAQPMAPVADMADAQGDANNVPRAMPAPANVLAKTGVANRDEARLPDMPAMRAMAKAPPPPPQLPPQAMMPGGVGPVQLQMQNNNFAVPNDQAMGMPGAGFMPNNAAGGGMQLNLEQARQGAFGGQRANFFAERELRQQGNYKELFRRRLGRDVALPQEMPPLIAREYAHQHAQNQDAVRRDFTETVAWFPALVLPGGEVEVGFDLSDAVTRYQVTVFSHSLDGRLGANRYELAARLPFSIDPKVPFEISNTDKVVVPVAVRNDSENEGRVELSAKFTGLKTQDPQTRDVLVGAKDRLTNVTGMNRGLFTCEPALVAGDAQVRVKGTLNVQPFGSDTVERSFKIVPDGFPMRGSASGMLEKVAVHEVPLPNAWVAGTLQCQVQVFPSTLAELQKGLEGLLREPVGCFEQSSSTNYPNVLILNYLQEAGQGDPKIEERARGLMHNGYQRLTSFECIDPKESTRRGYEWFGQTAPPHEALTAYGLLQFHDMAKIYPVDAAMVERTTKYLLDQRDGKGGFKRNVRAIDSFGRAPDHITSAYIVWSLTDSGVKEDLSPELTALFAKAKDSPDPYFTALVTLGHVNAGKTEDALDLAKKLRDVQKDDGHLEGTQTSITGSKGRDLHLETTALAVLAWLKANRPDEFHTSVQKAVKWISGQRSGQGSFGATQSTILALKALIAFTRDSKKVAEDGKLTVTLPNLKDAPLAATSFTAGAAEPITLTLPEGRGLQPGKNKVLVEITGKNVFPYTLSWAYQTLTPPSDAGCPVKLSAKLDKAHAEEGNTVKLHATIENATDQGHGMTVAILGLPAGLALPEDAKQLKELAKLRDNDTKPGTISSWELRGRELILYWRDLAPKAKIDVELDLICRLPGTYRGPASRAYLYYSADRKHWIEPLSVIIDPQRGE
jgi:hypothetical protein